MKAITPVLLSGGTGSRLWPLSREAYPKQLLSLVDRDSLLQATMRRVDNAAMFGPAIVIANAEHRFVIAEQLRAIDFPDARIVLEPFGRNTCPAAAVAAILAYRNDPESIILIMPADHRISDTSAFQAAMEIGLKAAQAGRYVLFGVPPHAPATGYGYIETGGALDNTGIRQVLGFTEKPDRSTAENYLSTGRYFWNSGIFLLPARTFLEELSELEPQIVEACTQAVDLAAKDLDFLRLDPAAFERNPNISIDYAVMERTSNAVVVDMDCGWSDIGTWSSLWEVADKGDGENSAFGDVLSIDTKGCYIRSEGPLVGALGVEDLVIVATADAVLVTRKDRDQDVKLLVDELKKAGHQCALQTTQVHRPWGYFQSIHLGERFQVKRITVAPGAKLSLQKHYHRAEHWIVVNGTALVTRDAEEILLRENESIYLPLGCIHRLANPGKVPLNLIEVQSGAYLGEDDIIRFEDDYARN